MAETRDFPTEVIASISSGVLLCDFGKMHEAAEYLMGHSIWTHHFADKMLVGEMKRAIAEQAPGMPAALPDVDGTNWEAARDKLIADHGPTIRIRKGGGLTAMLPTDGIPDHLKDSAITIEV